MSGCNYKKLEDYKGRLTEILDEYDACGELRNELNGFFREVLSGFEGPRLSEGDMELIKRIKSMASEDISMIQEAIAEVEIVISNLISSLRDVLFPRIKPNQIEGYVRDLFSMDVCKMRTAFKEVIRNLKRVGLDFDARTQLFDDYFELLMGILKDPSQKEETLEFAISDYPKNSISYFDFARMLEDPELIYLNREHPLGRYLKGLDFVNESYFEMDLLLEENSIVIRSFEMFEMVFERLNSSQVDLFGIKVFLDFDECTFEDHWEEIIDRLGSVRISHLIFGKSYFHGGPCQQHTEVERPNEALFSILKSDEMFPELKKVEFVIIEDEYEDDLEQSLEEVYENGIMKKIDFMRISTMYESTEYYFDYDSEDNVLEIFNRSFRKYFSKVSSLQSVELFKKRFNVNVVAEEIQKNNNLYGMVHVDIFKA